MSRAFGRILGLLMTCFRRCALTILAILGFFAVGTALFLHSAVTWLKSEDVPNAADAIVVLAGSFERSMYAADLYARGMAPRILLSVPRPENSLMRLERLGVRYPRPEAIYKEILLKKGVPEQAIELVATGAISTIDEAEVFASRMKSSRMRVLVVTSPYHVRRAAMAFRDACGDEAQIAVVGTPYEPLPDAWWTSQDAARNVLLETVKILLYLGGGRFRPEEGRS
jgi:uncharacterized SAM-binding protein YcdF (DUF218 family)